MLSEKELRQLAKKVYEGQVFLSHEPEEARMCFLPLILASSDQVPENVVAVYEDMSQAMPRGINGKPMFCSCKFLNKDEFIEFVEYFKEYEQIAKRWEE